jgi:hypothetical protein
MSPCQWVVYERGNRWATALRIAVARVPLPVPARDRERARATADDPVSTPLPRMREVRSLAELTQQLDTQPHCFAMLEVHRANVGQVLAWLAVASRRYPRGRFAGLLDASLASPAASCQDVVDALVEAGATDVAVSPRRLQRVLALAKQHWNDIRLQMSSDAAGLTLHEWAWSRLPWQDS